MPRRLLRKPDGTWAEYAGGSGSGGGYAKQAEVDKLSEAIENLPKSDDDEIEMLIAADLLPAVTTASGAILTNNGGNIILRY